MNPTASVTSLNSLPVRDNTNHSKVISETASDLANLKILDANKVTIKIPLKEEQGIYSQVFNIRPIHERIIQYLELDELRRLGESLMYSAEYKPLFSSVKEKVRNIVFSPLEIVDSNWGGNHAWVSYLGDIGSWETRGTPQSGMTDYTTECKEIKKVFSYQEGKNNLDSWIMFGELTDGSVFHFEGGCDDNGFGCHGGGGMKIAPSWRHLFDHLLENEIKSFVDNMSDNRIELKQALKNITSSEDLGKVLALLFTDKTIPNCLELMKSTWILQAPAPLS